MASEKKTTEDVPVPEVAVPTDPRAATYTVQRLIPATGVEAGVNVGPLIPDRWEDVATVTVPARARRRKVIGLALAQSGLRPEVGGDPLRLRVLDAASAHETSVAAVQAEPTFEF
jgi:hypothetical protein